MVRTANKYRQPISNALRVRMHRERKKMKLKENEVQSRMNNSSTIVEPSTSSTLTSSSSSSSLCTELRDWSNSHFISKRALDDLLHILNSNGISSLPKNHRSLLKTQVNLEIVETAGGSLWYNGIEKSIKQLFSTIDCDITVSLNVNIDGLPLYKSSKTSFWPILASIHGICAV